MECPTPYWIPEKYQRLRQLLGTVASQPLHLQRLTHRLQRYRGQEAGDSKVQTVIWYDHSGKVLAVGAEEPSQPESEEDEWQDVEEPIKTEWWVSWHFHGRFIELLMESLCRFKILLGQRRAVTEDGVPRTRLPASKTDIVDVFADFYAYLYDRARAYIKETHANGASMWDSFAGDIDFILTHPNDWGGAQQTALKRAAAKAGLISNTAEGFDRIQCVTEGEASLHYCISSGLIADAITVCFFTNYIFCQ